MVMKEASLPPQRTKGKEKMGISPFSRPKRTPAHNQLDYAPHRSQPALSPFGIMGPETYPGASANLNRLNGLN